MIITLYIGLNELCTEFSNIVAWALCSMNLSYKPLCDATWPVFALHRHLSFDADVYKIDLLD